MSAAEPSYSHLDPALRTLTGDARRLWGDRQERHRALEAIIAAYAAGDEPELRRAIQRVDDAVVQGLRALGLPRGPVRLVDFRDVPRSWQGIKEPGCHIIINARLARLVARTHQLPDDLFRTWVHESLHARQPFAEPGYRRESDLVAGYEEGLVEGLARIVTRDRASMSIVESSYNLYVAAYETLAEVLRLPVETIWRALWAFPPGQVRDAFLPVIERHLGFEFTTRQRLHVGMRATTVFLTDRQAELDVDRGNLRYRWEQALAGHYG